MAPEHRKINILEIHSSFGYAGGQRNMFSFVKHINKDLFQPFAASYIEGGIHEKKYSDLGVETVLGNGSAAPVLQFIKDKKIDVIHIHRSGGTVPVETEILQGAKKINPDILIVEKNVFGKYDATNESIIDCSFFQSKMHLNERYLPSSGKHFDFEKMKVLYNIIDPAFLEPFRMSADQINSARHNYGIGEKDFVLGRIGRPDIAKCSDLVLDSAPYLERSIPNFKYLLLGVPSSRIKKINSSAVLKKHFIILPATGDDKIVEEFYQVIDVLGHSSKIGECNGNTINEAMFWGKPVITNSTPRKDNGQLEQIEHMVDGVIANTPQTFARAAVYLEKDKAAYQKMSVFASQRIRKQNDPRQIVGQVEKFIIEKLAKNAAFGSLADAQKYDKIAYHPGEEQIRDYRKNYRISLKQDFGTPTILERMGNALRLPVKGFKRLYDFAEHKSQNK